ncbi:proline dehydrogenase 1, mitochondrial-like [Macadamia integrifolia]|uniref:proline dehydrogenase 1, mitochondrial-like n=1 Tax=Macadamia integrifolia TaxID=60698 RepID=UPI001C500085|nr:proline dehydrogenase 1, mitochondrial-like [Macadamia integrifolia]
MEAYRRHMHITMTAVPSCLRRLPGALEQLWLQPITMNQVNKEAKILYFLHKMIVCNGGFDDIWRMAAAKAQSLGIGKANQRLQFAQLKGMAEGLSFGLRNAGFQVSKCLPFGPVEKVIPYLLRRAEENRGLLSASTVDRQLMSMELKRRLKGAILGREIN